MMLTEQLKNGKELKIKHEEYQFTIKAKVKLNNGNVEVESIKISLPQKASRGEKLLLKLVQIYCYDVLQSNFIRYVSNSPEFIKLQNKVKNEVRNPLNER